MTKPKYLLPFIYVYKAVLFLVVMPFKLVNYSLLGFFVATYFLSVIVSTTLFNILKYAYKGFIKIFVIACRIDFYIVYFPFKLIYGIGFYAINGVIVLSNLIYKLLVSIVKYPIVGFVFISYYTYLVFKIGYKGLLLIVKYQWSFFGKYFANYKEIRAKKKAEAERQYLEKRQEYIRRHEERLRKDEDIKAKKAELIEERKKQKEYDTYENKEVVIEKKTIGDRINEALVSFIKIPIKIKKSLVNAYNNSSVIKNMRNKRDIEREALLISFEIENDRRSNVKQLYEYTAKNAEGDIVKGYFDAYSRVEVHSFLLSEGFDVYSIKTNEWIKLLHGSSKAFKVKIKVKDLVFFLTQLSTYIKAGIPLVDALKILTNQFNKNKGYQRIFRSLIYDLTMGDSFSEAMTKQGDSFPRILINMVKAAEMTGQLPEVLDDMGDYFTEMDNTKKQMTTVMMYPAIILVIATIVIGFIMIFVIPRFVEIYDSLDSSQIPAFTLWIVSVSEFLQTSWYLVIIGVAIFIIIFRYLLKNVKLFKTLIQYIIMHIPVVGQVVIFNEVTMFSKTFSSLLAHNVFITESMDILNKITNNEIYKMIILDTITNLAKGEKISESFRNHWAFPIPAYEMIVTGEKTGQLPEMMAKVSNYYQEQHKQSVSRIKAFIEPILIIFLTVVVGGIVLAIVIPMFNMYQTIQA